MMETHNDSDRILENDESNLSADKTDNHIVKEDTLLENTKRTLALLKRRRRIKRQTDLKIEKIFRMLQHTTAQAQFLPPRDRFSVFGELVASKLRTYSPRTEAIVEYAINNILFQADMGNYERFQANNPVIYNQFLNCPVTSSSTASCNRPESL